MENTDRPERMPDLPDLSRQNFLLLNIWHGVLLFSVLLLRLNICFSAGAMFATNAVPPPS